MPRELIAVEPRKPALREYDDPELGPRQIRILTQFASPKHGTEGVFYRDELSARRPYDPELGCVIPRPLEAPRNFPLGNMAVGVVTEAGPEVTRFGTGERVFGHFPIRETHTVDEGAADPVPEGLSPEALVCLDPLVMALAMRDARIRLGDQVAVFGLGAIGLMAVQLARIAGTDKVIAVDPIEVRRKVAAAFGADVVLNPLAEGGDAGLAIRRISGPGNPVAAPLPEAERVLGGYWEVPTQWGHRGVDVAVEASGSVTALQQAIRATRFGGTVCMISFYGGDAAGLMLGDEFHVNRLQLVSARVESLPLRDGPAWTLGRLVDVALRWLASGRVRSDGIVTPIVPFEESAEAYREIDEHPERSIKLGIRFDDAIDAR